MIDIHIVYDLSKNIISDYNILPIKDFNLVEWIRLECTNDILRHKNNNKELKNNLFKLLNKYQIKEDKNFTYYCQAIACDIFQRYFIIHEKNPYLELYFNLEKTLSEIYSNLDNNRKIFKLLSNKDKIKNLNKKYTIVYRSAIYISVRKISK